LSPLADKHFNVLGREMIEMTFGESLPELRLRKSDEAVIVFLTGFITFADWLGSNETFFRPETRSYAIPFELTECRQLARQKTRDEMDWLRWGETAVQPGLPFDRLFPFPANAMQCCLPELATQPGLLIVEAPMGSGKTEAALATAYRRWTADNGERGLYFALPSQLTSERILDRLEEFLSHALARPDLATLVHSSAWLRDEKRVLEIRPASPEERPARDDNPAIEHPAEYARDARLWFASSRQALLAPFGAGTVDQRSSRCCRQSIAVSDSSVWQERSSFWTKSIRMITTQALLWRNSSRISSV
jgi:CRISPR-associated endonuclease/helicase Cas3